MIDVGVSYFGVRRVRHVRVDLEALVDFGATYVVHLMTEGDLDYYRQTMGEIVRATHDAGLAVWLDPCAVGHVFGGTEFPSELAVMRPELAQRDDLGRSLSAVCPNQPDVRSYFREWIDVAVDLGSDVLFWDEPHLWIGSWYEQPDRSACYCAACRRAFSERFGGDLPPDPRHPDAVAFRQGMLLDFLAELLGYARAKKVRNAVTLLPTEYDADGGLDWDAVAGLRLVDNLGSDPYPFPSFPNQTSRADSWPDLVRRYADRVVEVTGKHGIENHLWVQGFSVPRLDHGYLERAIPLAVEAGITNIGVWGFDGHRDMSRFACEDPDLAWERLARAVTSIRNERPERERWVPSP